MGSAWLVPDWPAPDGVRAVFTLRGMNARDGASRGPWRFFNLGDHVGDDAAAVATNRVRLRDALGARPVFLRQVHGTGVATLAGDTPDGISADAVLTSERALACTIMVADCLPVLLSDARGQRVAAIHAGWRGLAAGVLEQTLARLRASSASGPAPGAGASSGPDVLAWLGPCIGPEAFEVGPEVHAAFVDGDPMAAACFIAARPGKYLADLQALARQRLQRLGVSRVYGNDGGSAWCTVGNASRYFSHRRDQRTLGATGRMAACIWRH